MRDLGGCEKKVMAGQNDSRVGSGVVGAGYGGMRENEPGYQVMADNSYLRNAAQKEAIFVPINRKTVEPNDYKMVDTKLNEAQDMKRPRNIQGDDLYGEDEKAKRNQNPYSGVVGVYDPNNGNNRSKVGMQEQPGTGGHYGEHAHGSHPHECPDCHGFFCRTCGATIPPQYRPFWDEDESPEMVEFYKRRIRQERERERKLRDDCKHCNLPKYQNP